MEKKLTYGCVPMDPSTTQKEALKILGLCLELPEQERRAFLDEMCPDQPHIIAAVLELLKARRNVDDFMESSPIKELTKNGHKDKQVGAYKLVRVLGEAFSAIADQRWEDAVGHLTVAMADHARIGGSRAQRDLVEFSMVNALLRLGRAAEARRLLSIRRPVTLASNPVKGL